MLGWEVVRRPYEELAGAARGMRIPVLMVGKLPEDARHGHCRVFGPAAGSALFMS